LAVPLLALCVACGGGGGGGGGFEPPRDLDSVTPDALTAARTSYPGKFAADLLRSTYFTSIRIEIDHPVSRPPHPGALALLEQRFAQRCDKPGGVVAVVDDAIPDDDFPDVSTVDDLDDLVATWRDEWPDESTGVQAVYVLYAKGKSDLGSGAEEVVGLSWHGGTMAVFTDVVDDDTSAFVTAAEVEGTVLVHEGGHLLGLVNSGVPMVEDHEDPDHAAHDVASTCVMYWLLQVPVVAPNLGDPDFAVYDLPCATDIAAFGGLPVPLPLRVRSTSPGGHLTVGACPTCRR
jgi:hypothetical protein